MLIDSTLLRHLLANSMSIFNYFQIETYNIAFMSCFYWYKKMLSSNVYIKKFRVLNGSMSISVTGRNMENTLEYSIHQVTSKTNYIFLKFKIKFI